MTENIRILVIDDDDITLKMVQTILQLEGYDVAIAADTRTGMALMKDLKPHLVLLDVMMPDPDGFAALGIIRQFSTVPVIMLSGRKDVKVFRDTLNLGADDYITKPFGSRELIARIRAKLRRSTPKLQHPDSTANL